MVLEVFYMLALTRQKYFCMYITFLKYSSSSALNWENQKDTVVPEQITQERRLTKEVAKNVDGLTVDTEFEGY